MAMLSVKIQRTIRNHYLGFDEDDDIHYEWLAEVLIDGEWLEFGICNKDKNIETTFSFPFGRYLGSSTETRFDGVRQESSDELYHFWTRAEDTDE